MVQINEGLCFPSRRLATRCNSNATNIAEAPVTALLNLIIKFNIQEIQVVKTSQDHISSIFSLKICRPNNKPSYDRRIYHYVSCSQFLGFFPLGLCRRQSRNRQIHRQVCWKRHRISGTVGKERNIGFVGFLGNVEPKWYRKYQGPSLLKNIGGTNLIVCVSMTSPCSLNRSTTFLQNWPNWAT